MDIIKELQNLDCYLNHERQEVYGFCLNAACCHQPQFCFQCCKIIHQSHVKDCKSINEIGEFLYELHQKFESNQDKIQQIYKQIEVALILIRKRQSAKITNEEILMEELKNIIKFKENHFQIYKTQLINIIEQLEIKNYGEIRNQIRIIKHLYQFSQNKIDQLTQFLMDFFDFFKIIKTSLEINLKLDYKSQQITKEMIESLKKTVNDYIIYNIDFTNSTIVKNYTLKQLELLSQSIQFTDQYVQTQKQTQKSFNFIEFELNEDDFSQANETPKENDLLDESKIFQSKNEYLTQHFIETNNNNNLDNGQDIIIFNQLNLEGILIVENLQQQGGIIKLIYNIIEQNEQQCLDSVNEDIYGQIQEFNKQQTIQQPVQIDQQNTNEEQNNLAYYEQNQLDEQLLYYDNYMLYAYRQQQYEQNENTIMNQDLEYEQNIIIEVQQIH